MPNRSSQQPDASGSNTGPTLPPRLQQEEQQQQQQQQQSAPAIAAPAEVEEYEYAVLADEGCKPWVPQGSYCLAVQLLATAALVAYLELAAFPGSGLGNLFASMNLQRDAGARDFLYLKRSNESCNHYHTCNDSENANIPLLAIDANMPPKLSNGEGGDGRQKALELGPDSVKILVGGVYRITAHITSNNTSASPFLNSSIWISGQPLCQCAKSMLMSMSMGKSSYQYCSFYELRHLNAGSVIAFRSSGDTAVNRFVTFMVVEQA